MNLDTYIKGMIGYSETSHGAKIMKLNLRKYNRMETINFILGKEVSKYGEVNGYES